jgi:hypothetical protein
VTRPVPDHDLFVSYAHADDAGGWVTALVAAVAEEHARFSARPLSVFFDRDDIRAMDQWEHRILAGLRASRVLLAVLSPAYFASPYCRKEWELYLDNELARALPGEGIAPIYVVTVPGFADGAATDRWLDNLGRRQFVDLRPWFPEGAEALRRAEVRRRLEWLEGQIADRLERADRATASPTTVPPHNQNFVGRVEELRRLREELALGRVGAITAVHGIGGIGKSALAFEYAHAFAADYPGGRFLLSAAGARDLRPLIAGLAPQRGIELTEAERADPERAFARVRADLEAGPPALLVLDNVDEPALLAPEHRARYLPSGGRVHVLATTRLEPERLPGMSCLPLDTLPDDDALRLLERYRPPQGEDEWKAALRVARRLGGHALAVEVVAVYLWKNPEVSYAAYLDRLEREGLGAVEGAGQDELVVLSRHSQKLIGPLLAPTLDGLSAAETCVLQYAALLPPDHVPLPWLRELAGREYPELANEPAPGYPDPWQRLERRLSGLRLLVRGDEPRLARMHRLVQEVVGARTATAVHSRRRAEMERHALTRAKWLSGHWGGRDTEWEAVPLREYARLFIQRGERAGVRLVQLLSNVLRQHGQLIELGDLLQRAVMFGERLAARAPDSADYARDLSVSYERLGDLHMALGAPQRALGFYQKALAARERLAARAPDSADYAPAFGFPAGRWGRRWRARVIPQPTRGGAAPATSSRGWWQRGYTSPRRTCRLWNG